MRQQDIPEDDDWDRQNVAELISCIRRRHEVSAEQMGEKVWFTFDEAGETWRYEWAIGGRNQWLHVRRDRDWEEVWSTTSTY